MTQLIPILCLLAGALMGASVIWWITRRKVEEAIAGQRAQAATEIAVLNERLGAQSQALAGSHDRIESLQGDVAEMRNQWTAAQQQVVALSTTLQNERAENAEKLKLIEQAEKKLSDAFQSLARQALQSNNESFLQLAKAKLETQQMAAAGELEKRQQAIDKLVEPLQVSLKSVDEKIGEMEKARSQAYGSLTQQVASLLSTEEKLRLETANLVKALRTPNVRGRWGELQLRRVVELAGMIDHCDFYEQESVETEDGSQRPDLRVRLPGEANIVVDAKVPLVAFIEAMEATDDATRVARLKDHARAVAERISELGKKAYWEGCQPSPELVVLFLPGEHFYTAALEYQPDLIERGVAQKVVVATPMTLISMLRAFAVGWRHERLAKNAEEVSKLGRELYERIRTLTEHFSTLERSIGATVRAYNNAVGCLETRVVVSARRFRDLGAAVGEPIEELNQVDSVPRHLQAEEFSLGPVVRALPDDEDTLPILKQASSRLSAS